MTRPNPIGTAKALWSMRRQERQARRLRSLSPEQTQRIVNTLERQGMAVPLDLEVPGWRTKDIARETHELEPAERLVVPPQLSGLGEEHHAWSPLRAHKLKNVVLDVDSGLVFAADRVVAQSGSGTRASRDAAFVSGASIRVARQAPIHKKGPIAPLGDLHHHYHVLIETLPRLARLAQVEPGVTVVTSTEIPQRYRAMIETLNIAIEHIRPGTLLTSDTVVLVDQPELFWPRPSDIRLVRATLGVGEQAPTRRLYISRRVAARSLANEAELEQYLQHKGFESVLLEELPLDEQARLFEQAGTVVAPHGAGLSNIAFMAAEASVIELTSGEFYEHCYRRMSAALGLDHRVVVLPGSPDAPFGRASDAVASLQHLLP